MKIYSQHQQCRNPSKCHFPFPGMLEHIQPCFNTSCTAALPAQNPLFQHVGPRVLPQFPHLYKG